VLGLGCNNFGMRIDESASVAVVHAALEAGINHFDTAESYGQGHSEEFLGKAVATRRDEVVIATKFTRRNRDEPYSSGALAQRIRSGCESSLRRLGTDRIDLYYQHYPDPDAPLDEVLSTLQNLVEVGKVLYIATSNATADYIKAADRFASDHETARFCGVQAEWNLLNREVETDVVPTCEAASVGMVPYFPLASGMLTGKYRAGEAFPAGSRFDAMPFFAHVATDNNFRVIEKLSEFAHQRSRTLLELAIAWLAAQQSVSSIICGATTPAQVHANAHALDWQLSPEDLVEVAAVMQR